MRRYVVQAASTPDTGGSRNRDKVTEFFDKMAPEIHSRPEWRDWFGTPLLWTVQIITDSDFLTMHGLRLVLSQNPVYDQGLDLDQTLTLSWHSNTLDSCQEPNHLFL